MQKLTFSDIPNLRAGDRLMYDGCVGKVERDPKYSNGLKCNGVSVKHLLDAYDCVEWVRYAFKESECK